ncbi:amylo-alpha-1,6-glucosidase [Paracoccus aurantiacus]|uniref:amylo-alpha-1,6-glucosidase n=1 Tax=Paracoccus aurantiacus TaxID=2599412 RepID=UPI00363988D2
MTLHPYFEKAAAILAENDRGSYTVPTKGLYPFQWNWDSCLTALGQAAIDESRALTEIETLFDHQWSDGMVPHIVFHVMDDGYFPGPDVWDTARILGLSTPTSGITQPPVAGFALARLMERSADADALADRARALVVKINRWHDWFLRARDPRGEGLVAILHPWESGRDNSIDWDEAFDRVPTDGIAPYTRRDTQHADPAHRPTKAQYDRYLWLVERFRSLNWDNTKLHDASPFQMVDPGFNAILLRSCADLADLADRLGMTQIAAANRDRAAKGIAAMESLWSERHGQYLCRDRVSGELVDSASVGGLLAGFAPVPEGRAAALAARIDKLSRGVRYLVPSHDPADPRFDARRYWRGPVWLIVNYMIADGLARAGQAEAARRIREASLDLIDAGGFAEYYDPLDGTPCGGGSFTWTAAMVIEFLREE